MNRRFQYPPSRQWVIRSVPNHAFSFAWRKDLGRRKGSIARISSRSDHLGGLCLPVARSSTNLPVGIDFPAVGRCARHPCQTTGQRQGARPRWDWSVGGEGDCPVGCSSPPFDPHPPMELGEGAGGQRRSAGNPSRSRPLSHGHMCGCCFDQGEERQTGRTSLGKGSRPARRQRSCEPERTRECRVLPIAATAQGWESNSIPGDVSWSVGRDVAAVRFAPGDPTKP